MIGEVLLQPDLPYLIVIDEPELGLHPFAIKLLVAMTRAASTRAQLIVSTQSVTLVDELRPEEVIVVDRAEKESSFRRLDPANLQAWLDNYSLGEIWQKNVIAGRPASRPISDDLTTELEGGSRPHPG